MTHAEICAYLEKGERLADALHAAAHAASLASNYPRAARIWGRIANLYARLDDMACTLYIER